MTSLRVQSVLFGNDAKDIKRTLDNLSRAAELAAASGDFSYVAVAYGDCSPTPVFSDGEFAEMKEQYKNHLDLSYIFFGANLGSAKGQNTLLENSTQDFVLIMNPDIVVSPNVLSELKRPFTFDGTGMVEARQLPIEHPKIYDASTGETSWAATACALISKEVLSRVGNFDHESFFLYCDDVDFSWRIRLAGFKVIYQPTAAVFHDKRLSVDGGWVTTYAERYYSAEAALFLTYKWSRDDLNEEIIKNFGASGVEHLLKAANTFEQRRSEGNLPPQIDPKHQIAQFVQGNYSLHRFVM